jgi:hypothetical protein
MDWIIFILGLFAAGTVLVLIPILFLWAFENQPKKY